MESVNPVRGNGHSIAKDSPKPISMIPPSNHQPQSTSNRVKTYHALRTGDPGYPARLHHLFEKPNPVFVRGTLPSGSRPHLAVVGTRRATPYGLLVTKQLIEPLAAAGVVIVSGLAYGIDAAAHRAALAVGGTTVAVLGCGIDRVYPAAHVDLAREILETGGAIASEYEPGTPSYPANFPARNRIVAALAHAVLVVEAPLKSGALITAYGAAEMGRDVLAVPGPVTSETSDGCHGLIARGARIVTSVEDVFDTLQLDRVVVEQQNHATVLAALSGTAKQVLAAVRGIPSLEELSSTVQLPTEQVLAAITELELAGLLTAQGGGRFAPP